MEHKKEKRKTIERYEDEDTNFSFKNKSKEIKNYDINFLDNKWESIELNLRNNKNNNIFNKEGQNYSKGYSLIKQIEWDDFDEEETEKNTNSFLNKIDELNLGYKLKSIIHPIDNSFEEYTNKKIQELENLKSKISIKKEENEELNFKDIINSNSLINQNTFSDLPNYIDFSIIKEKNNYNLINNNNPSKKVKSFLINEEEKNNKNNLNKINKYIEILKKNSKENNEIIENNNNINEKLLTIYNIILPKPKHYETEKHSTINTNNENDENTKKSKDYFEQIFEKINNGKIKNLPLKKRSKSSKNVSFLKTEENDKRNKKDLDIFLTQNKQKKNINTIPIKNPKNKTLIRYQKKILPDQNIKIGNSNKEVMKKIGENKRLLKILFPNNTHS